ncbi:MAG: choice-of-anchor J domain-containing protein [Bacteroidota bacterium]
MKKITLLAAFFAAFAMNAQVTIWEESFDSFDDFIIADIGDWSQIDVDASVTYGSTDFEFENEGYTGTAIVFNAVTMDDADPGDPQDRTAWLARTGDKGLYMFAATSLLNDDYIITPQINLTGATGSSITFWAKSLTDAFGLERFEVLLSTTGTDVGDFSVDLSGGEQQAPLDYTEYTYDLSAYDGQQVYIAIHYMAQDSFVFQMDDFIVEAASLGVNDNNLAALTYVVSDATLELRNNLPLSDVSMYNVLGQQVVSQKLSSTSEIVNISALTSGVYIAKVVADGQSKTIKIIKR